MKHNRFLRTAGWLWALAVLSSAMLAPGITQAKYAASATGSASARVAKWNAFRQITETQLSDDEIDGYAPVLLLFPDANPVTTTLTIVNNSEVTARYLLVPSVLGFVGTEAAKDEFLDAINDSLADNEDYAEGYGIVVPYDGQATLTAGIPPATFARLSIEAIAVQVD